MAKKHARYSPSTLASLTKCLRFKYSDVDNDAADEGTMLHSAFETGILTGLDEEQRNAVQSARDYVDSLKATHGGPDCWYDGAERRVELVDLTYGTADRVLIHKTMPVMHVIDAKFGRVINDYDMQVRTYGAALVEEWPNDSPWQVHTHVIVPRVGYIECKEYPDGSALLTEVRDQITILYARLEDWFNGPTPHADLCSKCANAARCPALGAVVKVAATGIGLPMPSAFAPDSLASERDRALAQVLAGALIAWGDQVKAMNTEYVKNGGQVEGFKMISRSNGLRIPSEYTALAFGALRQVPGVDDELILACSTITFGKLAKALSDKEGVTEGEAKERLREAVGDMGQESQSQFLQKSKRIADDVMITNLLNG